MKSLLTPVSSSRNQGRPYTSWIPLTRLQIIFEKYGTILTLVKVSCLYDLFNNLEIDFTSQTLKIVDFCIKECV